MLFFSLYRHLEICFPCSDYQTISKIFLNSTDFFERRRSCNNTTPTRSLRSPHRGKLGIADHVAYRSCQVDVLKGSPIQSPTYNGDDGLTFYYVSYLKSFSAWKLLILHPRYLRKSGQRSPSCRKAHRQWSLALLFLMCNLVEILQSGPMSNTRMRLVCWAALGGIQPSQPQKERLSGSSQNQENWLQ